MALAKMDFYSQSLRRSTSFNVILPNDTSEDSKSGNENYARSAKSFYLLHGYSGYNMDWLLLTRVYELAKRYNTVIILPSGENRFYLDAKGIGNAFGQYIGKELVEFTRSVFGLSSKREDTFIGGLSMGGFGAIHNALKYNKTFGKAVALSPALTINNIKDLKPGDSLHIADYDYFCSVFGDLDQLENSEKNPEYLIKSLLKSGEELPELYIACGTEDFLIEGNRAFKSFLDEHGVSVKYTEGTGVHDWNYWNSHIEPALQWLVE